MESRDAAPQQTRERYPNMKQVPPNTSGLGWSGREYVASLPERIVRAAVALVGGLVYETAEVLLPHWLRRSYLYQATIARLLRIAIELIGGVSAVAPAGALSAQALLARKTAGNAIELASFLAVGWSPLWLLAAAADLTGGTRVYLGALVAELRGAGVLPTDSTITSVEELLTTLERSSGLIADTIDMPPLSVREMRASWQALQQHVSELPDAESMAALFSDLEQVAAREGQSLAALSGLIALGALRAGLQLGTAYVFEYYRQALRSIANEGLVTYLRRVSRPYRARIVRHLDPRSATYTERLLRHLQSWQRRRTSRQTPPGGAGDR
jgi:hypothetical protein